MNVTCVSLHEIAVVFSLRWDCLNPFFLDLVPTFYREFGGEEESWTWRGNWCWICSVECVVTGVDFIGRFVWSYVFVSLFVGVVVLQDWAGCKSLRWNRSFTLEFFRVWEKKNRKKKLSTPCLARLDNSSPFWRSIARLSTKNTDFRGLNRSRLALRYIDLLLAQLLCCVEIQPPEFGLHMGWLWIRDGSGLVMIAAEDYKIWKRCLSKSFRSSPRFPHTLRFIPQQSS